MSAEKPRSGERFGTDDAAVLEVMSKDVHGQCRHADVDLATVGALLGVLAVQTAVCLLVTG